MAELSLVVEETDAEFDALRRLIEHSEIQADGGFILEPRARVAVANATVLYTASAFEEAVRQLGQAYIENVSGKAAIPDNRLAAIKAGLWERASGALTSPPFATANFDFDSARENIKVMQDFCLDLNDVTLMNNKAVYNIRNMRAKEVNNVFRRLGVENICNKVGRCNEFKAFFLVDSVAEAQDQFILFLNDFYETRNKATHELGAFRSQGAVDSRRFMKFFALAVRRLATVLQNDLDTIA